MQPVYTSQIHGCSFTNTVGHCSLSVFLSLPHTRWHIQVIVNSSWSLWFVLHLCSTQNSQPEQLPECTNTHISSTGNLEPLSFLNTLTSAGWKVMTKLWERAIDYNTHINIKPVWGKHKYKGISAVLLIFKNDNIILNV